ncbi:MAG: outer membrane lipoprotein-sorting protein [Pseudomonadota bacterium]
MKSIRNFLMFAVLLSSGMAAATPELTGEEIARQVDYVNRFNAVRNISYGERNRPVVLVDRLPGEEPRVNILERWRNNDYPPGAVHARDLVIFRGGQLRGTGILVTDFTDPEKGRAYAVWLPSLRKVRRFAEPDPADSWGNSNFTYGDIYIRRPEDEQHELVGTESFDGCLSALQLPENQRTRHTADIPEADCSVQGRKVYRLRSRPRRDLGYDERILFVDVETFADYRSVYYRNGAVLKVIDKSWRRTGLDDPRALYWVYWYARTEGSGREGMAFVPPDAVSWNSDLDPGLWSERTLRRIRR